MFFSSIYAWLTCVLATSTPVERLFSHGGMQVSKRRHNLSFETLRCLMVLRSWFAEGLVPESKVLEMIRDLRSRRNLSLHDNGETDL